MSENQKTWVISTILAILALVIPIAIYFGSLSEKALTYQLISKTALTGSIDSLEGVEILINDEKVENAAIVRLKIKNSGTDPIRASDFENQMLVKFPEGTQIFSVQIKNEDPKNLAVEQNFLGNIVAIKPLLLNSEDEFEVEILSNSQEYPDFSARILGIKSVETVEPSERKFVWRAINFVLMTLLIMFYSKSLFHAISSKNSAGSRIINLFLGLTCLFSVANLSLEFVDVDGNYFIQITFVLVTITIGRILAAIDPTYQYPKTQIPDTNK